MIDREPGSWWTALTETIYGHGVGKTDAGRLLTQHQVAAESGLAADLVPSLIPRSSGFAEDAPDSGEAPAYDEVGLWRAKLAKLLLDQGIGMNFVRVAVHEALTCAQLQVTVESIEKGGAPTT